MNMTFNKKLKLFWAVMAMLAITPLVAQNPMMSGFAGDDKELLFPFGGENPEESILIGTTDPHSEHCVFHWRVVSTPPGGTGRFSDSGRENPVFYVNSRAGEYLLEVTRVSSYGYQVEYMTVTVKNNIDLLCVTSKKECWNPGDPILEENFDFITSPPGFGKYVHINPETQEIGDDEKLFKKVKFKIWEPGQEPRDSDITEIIFIGGFSTKDLFEEYDSAMELLEAVDNLEDNYKKLKLYMDMIKGSNKKLFALKNVQQMVNMLTPPTSPVTFDHKMEMDTMDMDIKVDCCNDETAVFLEWNGGITFEAGVTLDIPIWPGVPKVGLMLVGEAAVGAKVECHTQIALPKYYECYELKIPVEIYGRFGIGLKVMALDEDLLSVKAVLSMTIHGSSEYLLSPKREMKFNGVYADGDFTVEGSFIGFSTELYKFEFPKYYLIDGEE